MDSRRYSRGIYGHPGTDAQIRGTFFIMEERSCAQISPLQPDGGSRGFRTVAFESESDAERAVHGDKRHPMNKHTKNHQHRHP